MPRSPHRCRTQGLIRGEELVKVGIFGQEADAAMAAIVTTVDAEDHRLPVCRRGEPQKDLESSALAGSVRTQQPINFARRDLEAEIVYRHDRCRRRGKG